MRDEEEESQGEGGLVLVTNVVRWVVVVVVAGHGLIHLLGVAKGLGWADVPQLKGSIGVGGAVLWLFATFSCWCLLC